MARLIKIPIEEAKQMKKRIPREAKVLEQYKRHINALGQNEAGKFKIQNNKEGFAIRARLKRAAQALGLNLVIRKRGNEIVFWKEEESKIEA